PSSRHTATRIRVRVYDSCHSSADLLVQSRFAIDVRGGLSMRPTGTYNDHVVRLFLLAAAVWGIVGMSIGVYAAAEMVWPSLIFGVPWLTSAGFAPTSRSAD